MAENLCRQSAVDMAENLCRQSAVDMNLGCVTGACCVSSCAAVEVVTIPAATPSSVEDRLATVICMA